MSKIPGLDYAGECRPADEPASEFFDFMPLAGPALGVSIAAISGTGIQTAIVIAGLKAFLRATVHACPSPSGLIANLNRLVCDVGPETLYATLFYAHIDPAHHTLRYVSAGHEPAFLIRNRTSRLLRLERTGTVLGLSGRVRYEERALPFEPGDTLVAVSESAGETLDLPHALHTHSEARSSELIGHILGCAQGRRDFTAAMVRFRQEEVGQAASPAAPARCLLPTC